MPISPSVSQISMPIRILLVGAVVFMAAWFTVLKPSDTVVPAAPATTAAPGGPTSTAGSFRDTAKAGAATAEKDALGAANADIENTTGAPAPATSAPSATAPSATSAAPTTAATQTRAQATLPPLPAKAVDKLPADVRAGLAKRKVIVLGVLNTRAKPWAPMADDDRAVRSALRSANRYGGNVVVETVTIGSLARYEGMLETLGVTQSPTVVVIDRNRKAVTLTGYVDRLSVNQAIADARRFSMEKRISDPYLAKVNERCLHYMMRYDRFSLPTKASAMRGAERRIFALLAKDRRSIARLAAPAKWRGLKAQMLRAQDLWTANARRALALERRGNRRAAFRALAADSATFAALDRRFNAVGLTGCASNRTR